MLLRKSCRSHDAEALQLEPMDPYTWAVRAEAQLCLGHREDAIGDCDQALELSPGLDYAAPGRRMGWKIAPRW